MKNFNIIKNLKIIVLALVIGLGVSFAYGSWVPPTGTAPSNNAPAPLNIGGGNQSKGGTQTPLASSLLNINGIFSANNILSFGDVGSGSLSYDANAGLDPSDFPAHVCADINGVLVLCPPNTGGGGGNTGGSVEYFLLNNGTVTTMISNTCNPTSLCSNGNPATFTVPAGVTSINVELVGGGGGGGMGISGGSNNYSGGGGGGGGFTSATVSVTPGSVFQVTAGKGGAGSGTNSSQTSGTSSIFAGIDAGGNTINIKGFAGVKGTSGVVGVNPGGTTPGGLGGGRTGSGTCSVGTVCGESGTYGNNCAGNTCFGGRGGDSGSGGAGGMASYNLAQNGSPYGGGGAGGSQGIGGASAGGAGNGGKVKISW